MPEYTIIQNNETADEASKQIAQTNQDKIQIQTYTDIKNQV